MNFTDKDKERFWAKVQPLEGGCWKWIGATSRGYGNFALGGKTYRPHRLVLFLCRGEVVPPDQDVHHVCENPYCVNPDHLRAVTRSEHCALTRGPAGDNARKTHCLRGHPLEPENLVAITTRNERRCLACHRHKSNERYAAKRAELADHRSEVPYSRIDGRMFFNRRELDSWLTDHREGGFA